MIAQVDGFGALSRERRLRRRGGRSSCTGDLVGRCCSVLLDMLLSRILRE